MGCSEAQRSLLAERGREDLQQVALMLDWIHNQTVNQTSISMACWMTHRRTASRTSTILCNYWERQSPLAPLTSYFLISSSFATFCKFSVHVMTVCVSRKTQLSKTNKQNKYTIQNIGNFSKYFFKGSNRKLGDILRTRRSPSDFLRICSTLRYGPFLMIRITRSKARLCSVLTWGHSYWDS